ncbi:MAG: hypothetical protein VST67_12255 [Nitrospirota bacterium]|nr:hypothetical protein [Nitrospirota bacterium]
MKVLRPLKAIRAKCLDCCAGQVKEIRECPLTECALWPYRMGKRPITENGSPTVEAQSVARDITG